MFFKNICKKDINKIFLANQNQSFAPTYPPSGYTNSQKLTDYPPTTFFKFCRGNICTKTSGGWVIPSCQPPPHCICLRIQYLHTQHVHFLFKLIDRLLPVSQPLQLGLDGCTLLQKKNNYSGEPQKNPSASGMNQNKS